MTAEHPLRRVVAFASACIAAGALIAGFGGGEVPAWSVGDVADRDVTVRESFTLQDIEATAERQADAEASVVPVYELDLAAAKRIESRLGQAFDMARRRTQAAGRDEAAIRADFVRALEAAPEPTDVDVIAAANYARTLEDVAVELLAVGMRLDVVTDRSILPAGGQPFAVVSAHGDVQEERVVDDATRVRSLDEARQAVSLAAVERFGTARDTAGVRAAAGLVRAMLAPSLRRADTVTEERRTRARAAVGTVEQELRRGTRVVAGGDVVTARQARLLAAMRNATRTDGGWVRIVAMVAFVAVLVASVGGFASSTIRKFTRRANEQEALLFILVLVVAATRALVWGADSVDLARPFDVQGFALLAPVAGGAMLVRVLVNSESAMTWSLVASVLAALTTPAADAGLVGYHLVTASLATRGVGQARERLAVLRAGLQAGGVGVVFALLVAILRAQEAGGGMPDLAVALGIAGMALAAGIGSAFLSLGIVPIFELFGFITDHKLHELASLNHPLLRQLMLRAPGTYHHSVIVGSLSEAACEAIGANALLARVACYFHDIGKGIKPQYFVENQREGPSRHERLSPEASAAVIINHVREGAALARQHKLPRAIVDNIFMHHGTGIISYFYARAQESAGEGVTVDDAPFRYPGPKPDSREAGVIMIADKVEAACRTIQQPSEPRFRAMIQQVVNGVMNDGQLEECPLTVRELHVIADTFTNVLMGIHHHRIEYPATKAISSGKLPAVPRQGTITLELMNPLKPPPLGAETRAPAPETAPDEA